VPQHGGGRVRAAEDRLGQREQFRRLLGAARRLPGPVRGKMNDAADADRDGDEQQQRQQVLRIGDRQGMHWLGEVPVQQQAGGHRGEHRGPEAADDSDGDDSDQVDQQVVGQAQPPCGDQGDGQQGQARDSDDPGEQPAPADAPRS